MNQTLYIKKEENGITMYIPVPDVSENESLKKQQKKQIKAKVGKFYFGIN